MVTGDSPGFSKGSQPPPETNEPRRLYSMRFCPFSQRARLALNFKELSYDVVNIDLRDKPDWYFAKNPLGKVPMLEEKGNDKGIFESLIIAEYLDDNYHAKNPLLPTDNPLKRAQQKMLVEVITSKITDGWHALMLNEDEEKKAVLGKNLDYIEELAAKELQKTFFGGENVGFIDLMIWPWFERLPAVEKFRGVPFNAERHPKLTAWCAKMRDHPQIKTSIYPTELHLQYFQTRNFNVGL
ncbi:putative Glutathione S-transferase omega-1 [Hypsibius exemplaris]|uniref:Glutathione S-transferase omega n=1 Tax=Hypsibius exemplaris TaxID=2072580 RepID=A0A1W0XE02_HYPEX|nr:putative Glutathione S-transferase omega-1 [Hypsibius exemplaris]